MRQLAVVDESPAPEVASSTLTPVPGRDWLTRREVADQLGVTADTVYRWQKTGINNVRLGVRYVGGCVRIPVANYHLFARLIGKRRGDLVQ